MGRARSGRASGFVMGERAATEELIWAAPGAGVELAVGHDEFMVGRTKGKLA